MPPFGGMTDSGRPEFEFNTVMECTLLNQWVGVGHYCIVIYTLPSVTLAQASVQAAGIFLVKSCKRKPFVL